MAETQTMVSVNLGNLVAEVQKMADQGYRLVQIGCTRLADCFELNYSFDKNYEFVNLRFSVPSNDVEIPSVSKAFLAAFVYENELHDLFGLKIKDIAIDFKGGLYRTAVKHAFSVHPSAEAKKA